MVDGNMNVIGKTAQAEIVKIFYHQSITFPPQLPIF